MWPFNKKKYDEDSITGILMKGSDMLINKGIMNEGAVEFIKMTLDTAIMDAENRMNTTNFVINRCEKMTNSCKDDKFRKLGEDIIKIMRLEENRMKENLNTARKQRKGLEQELDKLLEQQKTDKVWQ